MATPCSSLMIKIRKMKEKEKHTVYLGLGSNMGDRKEKLDTACQKIERLIGHIERRSAYHESEPWGFESPNMFLNAVICCLTTLSPRQLLRTTQRIERQLGRQQKTTGDGAYHNRPIDIDILLYDNLHIDEPDLTIPHPRMHLRPFVMEPLREIQQQT